MRRKISASTELLALKFISVNAMMNSHWLCATLIWQLCTNLEKAYGQRIYLVHIAYQGESSQSYQHVPVSHWDCKAIKICSFYWFVFLLCCESDHISGKASEEGNCSSTINIALQIARHGRHVYIRIILSGLRNWRKRSPALYGVGPKNINGRL